MIPSGVCKGGKGARGLGESLAKIVVVNLSSFALRYVYWLEHIFSKGHVFSLCDLGMEFRLVFGVLFVPKPLWKDGACTLLLCAPSTAF